MIRRCLRQRLILYRLTDEPIYEDKEIVKVFWGRVWLLTLKATFTQSLLFLDMVTYITLQQEFTEKNHKKQKTRNQKKKKNRHFF